MFYLDPGGFIHSNLSSIGITLYLLTTLLLAYFLFIIQYKIKRINIFAFKYVKFYIRIIVIWNVYYFVVFYGFNSNEAYPGLVSVILRSMKLVYNSLIVLPIIYFSIISYKPFIRILIFTTIAIGLAFIITVTTGTPLVETWGVNRRQAGNIQRTFMYGYGLMNYIIPFFISTLFLRIKYDNRILVAVLIVLSIMLMTVYRRDIVSVVEHLLITSVLVTYVENRRLFRSITKYINIKSLFFLLMFYTMLNVFTPNILISANKLFSNSLIELGLIRGNSSFANADVRLSLSAKTGILNAINNNFYLGTGFDQNWFLGDGGSEGWEGADYVFLSTFGMYGLVGLLLFLPFYILSIKVIYLFLKIFKSEFKNLINKNYLLLPLLIGLTSSSEIIRNIFEYPNWFYPIGAIQDRGKYFIFLGLLIGSYYKIKMELRRLKLIHIYE